MNSASLSAMRMATIAALAKRAERHGGIGRTALMKLVYFLQTLRRVPLGYDFRLYTYGPYDGQVLEDLKCAELLDAVVSTAYGHSFGMGYTIKPGVAADEAITRSPEVAGNEGDIEAVASEFGARSAIDLEMASTILFVDRAAAESGKTGTPESITAQVKELKPRLDLPRILQEAKTMLDKGYLRSVG